jgi:carboxypeptidase Q
LPGIGLAQDPIEYGTHTWHTNLDTYERILEEDVKKDAVVIATVLYQLSMRDELLPRFRKDAMPSPPPPPAATAAAAAAKPAPKPRPKKPKRRVRMNQ